MDKSLREGYGMTAEITIKLKYHFKWLSYTFLFTYWLLGLDIEPEPIFLKLGKTYHFVII